VAFSDWRSCFRLDAHLRGSRSFWFYVGAVAILVVFAILLTRGSENCRRMGVFLEDLAGRGWRLGSVFAVLGWTVMQAGAVLPNETATPQVTVNQIGQALMGRTCCRWRLVAVLLTRRCWAR